LTILLITTLVFAGTFVYCSFFEWTLHRFIMHDDRLMKYAYRAHQMEHHEIFKADSTYFMQNDPHTNADFKHVTFAWWNAPLLFAIHTPLFAALYFFVGGWAAVVGALGAMISYYALYEYLHFCMHVPANRAFERTKFFQFVQNHHRLHHVFYLKNLNVVVPIADVVLGTRVRQEDPLFYEKLEKARERKLARTASRRDSEPSHAPAHADEKDEALV
jgi:hypothetical protein